MEQQPHNSAQGGERPGVNSYGTDDPEQQARIEQARRDASEERRRHRSELERLVEHGLSADDAEVVIEFEEARRQRETSEDGSDHQRRLELLPEQPPRIYVSDVAAHEAGHVHGRWLDATDPLPELQEQVVALLAASPVLKADRYAIDIYTGFDTDKLDKHTPLAVISAIAQNIHRYGPAYSAYLSVIDIQDEALLWQFDDLHVGTFDSPDAWARAVVNDLDWSTHLDRVVRNDVRPFVRIDYAKFLEEARQHWDIVDGPDGKTHVFLR